MKQYVTQKNFFASLSEKLNFDKYIRVHETMRNYAVDIKEDVFESFNGVLFEICEKKIFTNSGYGFISIFINNIFKQFNIEVPTDISKLQKPRTTLKEIVDKVGKKNWKIDINHTFENQPIGPGKTIVVNIATAVYHGSDVRQPIRIAEVRSSTADDAKDKAASEALDWLKRRGITYESAKGMADAEKRKNIIPMEKEYRIRYPNISYKIHTLRTHKMGESVVGYYEEDLNGNYVLKLLKVANATPERLEEEIYMELLR